MTRLNPLLILISATLLGALFVVGLTLKQYTEENAQLQRTIEELLPTSSTMLPNGNILNIFEHGKHEEEIVINQPKKRSEPSCMAHWKSAVYLYSGVEWKLYRESDGLLLADVLHDSGDEWAAFYGVGSAFGNYDTWAHAKAAMEADQSLTKGCTIK